MLFFKDKDTGKECLYLMEDSNKQNYECIFSACPNPTCTCMTIDIDLTFMPYQNCEGLPKLCHSVEIDLDRRRLQTSPQKKLPQETLRTATDRSRPEGRQKRSLPLWQWEKI